ncbi:MAG: nucleotidyltransferase domain-containing protein [Acidimicrobiales bacterium]|nr:nucleotidyltransferase domain-containing protein [Acidimicrobiales bacterium]
MNRHTSSRSGVVEDIVRQIVENFHPIRVIVFGSEARGDATPESDIDLMVIFDEIDRSRRYEIVAKLMGSVVSPISVDFFVTDLAEYEAGKDVNGTMVYWPAHEGMVLHDAAVA